MTVRVASTSVQNLFSGQPISVSDGNGGDFELSGQLVLPEYQRAYQWGEKQLESLLGDLSDFFSDSNYTKHDYYLGSIILHQAQSDENRNTQLSRLNIIDGQQRITTLALLGYLSKELPVPELAVPELQYSAPLSQKNIARNLKLLKEPRFAKVLPRIDFNRINVTLVVTQSEDDAYQFFETQNTGGVRLSGPDIIKAHHLRAIDAGQQDHYAKLWEGLSQGDLNPLVKILLKSRHWNILNFKDVPSHRYPTKVKNTIVDEFGYSTQNSKDDIAYSRAHIKKELKAEQLILPSKGYAVRQPLNTGINSIEYMRYFADLRAELFIAPSLELKESLVPFYELQTELLNKAPGTAYIREVYEGCLLMYVSQFGLESHKLYEAALWLFRVVYSKRVINIKAVKESTLPAFLRDIPVFDWISSSFAHQALINRLKEYQYEINEIAHSESGVRGRYVGLVESFFGFEAKKDNRLSGFDTLLKEAIQTKLTEVNTNTSGIQEGQLI